MKKLVGILLLTMLVLPAWAKPLFKIQHWVTQNGAKVYFVNAPEIPMVDVQVTFHAGSAYDDKHWGLASITNSMIGQASTTLDVNQIAKQFDNVGAQFSSNVTRDMSYFSLRSLTAKKYLKVALDTFTLALTQVIFPDNVIQRIRDETIAVIRVSEQTPGSLARKLFYQTLYKNAPYAHPVIGTLDTVKTLTAQQMQAFYKRYYVANNAYVVIVGALTKAQAKQIAKKITAHFPKGRPAQKIPLAVSLKQTVVRVQKFPSKQMAILLGQVGINRQNKNYFPLIVGNFILGGSPMTSLLFDNIREKHGLAYAAYSYFLPLSARGPFIINLETRANKSKEALQLVQHTLDQFIANGPTQAELDAAKENLMGGFVLNLSTNQEIATAVRNIAFYGRPLDYLDHYRARVQVVTTLQIKQAFKELISPSKMVVVLVGPQAAKTGQKMV